MALSVVHDIPGRLRLRLKPPAPRPPQLEGALRHQPGVLTWAWSPRTRSLLVCYTPGETTAEAILGALAGIPTEATEAPIDPGVARPQKAALARAVTRSVSEANAALTRLTAGFVDVGTLLSLVLAGWAVREVMVGRVAPLAWSTALWYSHGLFRDYGVPEDGA